MEIKSEDYIFFPWFELNVFFLIILKLEFVFNLGDEHKPLDPRDKSTKKYGLAKNSDNIILDFFTLKFL